MCVPELVMGVLGLFTLLGLESWIQVQNMPLMGCKTLNKPINCSCLSFFVCQRGNKYLALSENCGVINI